METERVDLISGLPFEVLRRIVSFLPLKEAVRTSVLSTLWSGLWKPVQVNMEADSNENLAREMARFLRSREGPQQWKFHLKIREKDGLKMEDDLMFAATMGAEEELHLDFFGGIRTRDNFDLTLESSCLSPSKYSCLKTLHLRSANRFFQRLVSNLFSNFQFLESLRLENCCGLENVDIKANGYLQRFAMVDCPETASITLSALNLKSFRYRGALPLIQLKNSPDLVDVILDLREGPGQIEFDCEDVLPLLESLRDIETLTISSWLLEWLCTGGVIFGRLQFQFNRLKELRWVGPQIDQPKRDSLACFLDILPVLERLLLTIDQSCRQFQRPFFIQYWHEPHLWTENSTAESNASQLNHLEVVRLVGFTDTEDELLLMDHLLKRAFTAKSMILTSPGNRSWWVAKIPCSQMKQTSRCHSKHIGISFPDKRYFFGLREQRE
ncbi:F-box protein At2g39490-like [Diospyros lotus]|uniref:F-box protein At2g39490-like n=1 Tax=Diospyros lotus TaxID=55363 RepID=UPI002253C36D|nr:F-box protein At2g39490-like [Diospyros lotus]